MRSRLAAVSLGLAACEKPVTKIVNLLKEVEGELKAEIENDQTAFDKMQCWCKKTVKSTETGIEDAKTCIADETSSIESNTGKSANAAAAAAGLEEDIASDEATLKSATEGRQKASAEFSAAEQELTKAISALKGAITVLKKQQSFLQADSPIMTDAMAFGIRKQVEVFAQRHVDKISPAEKDTVEQFLQQPSYGAYSNQSGEIFGILGNMLDQFSQDLKEARDTESSDAAAFAEQKKLLSEKIAAASDQLAAKNEAKGEADTAKAASEDKLRKCTAAEEDLTKTLRETKTSCADNKAEFAERSEARAAELEAVGKAIAFLDSPEAFAKFNAAFSFVQVATRAMRARAHKALGALSRAGNMDIVAPLVELVQQQALARTGAKVDFSKVIKKIDDLVVELKAEIEKNTMDKDACVADINKKTQDLTATKNQVDKLKAKVAKLEETIADLTVELENNAQEKADLEAAIKTAGENRAIENANFQKATKENKAAIAVLKKAKEVLAPIFGESLLQQPAKPAGFSKYEKNAGGAKVMGMLDEIIGDTQKAVEVGMAEEKAAQTDYEKFQKDSNDSLDALASETAQLKGQKGDAEADLASTTEDLGNEIKSAQDQETALNARKSGCKFLMDNFETMQSAKKTEIEALNEAKAFLKGMQ